MELAEHLRVRGIRVTHPRQLVWEALSDDGGHLSAAVVAERVRARDPGVNLSSVYRALALFGELGLVRESRTGDDASITWEIRHPDGVIHLVCTSCASVIHHQTPRVDQLAREVAAAGFVPDAVDVHITGLCANCAPG